jgi:hypothetical protein
MSRQASFVSVSQVDSARARGFSPAQPEWAIAGRSLRTSPHSDDFPTIGIVCSYYGPPWNEGEKNIARALEIGLSAHGFSPRVYGNPAHDISALVRHRPSPAKIAACIRFWRATGLPPDVITSVSCTS